MMLIRISFTATCKAGCDEDVLTEPILTELQFVSPRGRKCASMEAKNEGWPEKWSIAMYHHRRALIVDRAKDLRKRETEAEAVLWEELRKRKLGGCKIRRQHPFGSYIADFYCSERKLVISNTFSTSNPNPSRSLALSH
jgi:hypothetical protein